MRHQEEERKRGQVCPDGGGPTGLRAARWFPNHTQGGLHEVLYLLQSRTLGQRMSPKGQIGHPSLPAQNMERQSTGVPSAPKLKGSEVVGS